MQIYPAGTEADPSLIFGGDDDTGLWHPASNTLAFSTFGNERMRIDSSGLVSIKNSGVPTLRLDNTDTSLTTQTLGSIEYYQNDTSDEGVGVVSRINCVNESVFAGYGALTFQTGNATTIAERIRIGSSGTTKIIATKAYGSKTATLRVATSPTGTNYSDGAYANIVFGDESIANSHLGEIQVVQTNASASTASTMRFLTNAGGGNSATEERMRIDSSGNVGIGNINPDFEAVTGDKVLTVSAASSRSSLILQNLVTGTTGVAGSVKGYNGTQYLAGFDFQADGATNSGATIFYNANNGSATESMRIDSSGNVSTGNLTVTNTTSGWTAYINNNIGSGTQSGLLLDAGSSSADFAMYVRNAAGSSDLFAIKGNGNVGIGTTTPQSKLHIQTDAAPTDIYLTDGTLGTDNYGGVVRGFSVAGQGGRLQLGTLDNDIYYPCTYYITARRKCRNRN